MRLTRARHAVEHFRQDLRYAARQLARAPFFTSVAAFSLGIGIAVAVIVFSLVNSVLFKPLPISDPAGLMRIYSSDKNPDNEYAYIAYEDIPDLKASGAFRSLAAWRYGRMKLAVDGFAPENIETGFVSPDFFQVAGVTLEAGRTFTPGVTQSEIIISERYRRRIYKNGEQAIGSTIRIRNVPFTVIGIAPEAFHGVGGHESLNAWISQPSLALLQRSVGWAYGERGGRAWAGVGRLADGVTREAATARLNAAARELANTYPRAWRDFPGNPLRVSVLTQRQSVLAAAGDELPLLLGSLAALVFVVLILACTNVAGLLLARAVTRRHEVTVRLTMGASRTRLITQLLTESVLLALIGGTVGLFIAQVAIRFAATNPMFDAFDLSPDWRVFAYTALASLCCALFFGITPTAHTLRVDMKAGLSGHGVVGERGGVRGRLMALQVCLAFLLIVLGSSASRGIRSQLQTRPGFEINGLLIAELGYPANDLAEWNRYIADATEMMRTIGGVEHTVVTTQVPLEELGWVIAVAQPKGILVAGYDVVDPEFFSTIGLPLIRGRVPRRGERSERRLAVVDRTMVTAAGHDLIGGSLHLGNDHDVVVVGIVEPMQNAAVKGNPRPYIYELRSDDAPSNGGQYLVTRIAPGAQTSVMAEFTRRMRNRYSDQVPPAATALRSRLDTRLAPQRYLSRIAFGVGAIELALAAIGLYSLLLYATLTRTREIGLRMALGARPVRASFTVMKEGLIFVAAGATMGLALAVPACIFFGRGFIGMQVNDPVPFIVAASGLIAATLMASLVPARKAALVEPMEALRHD